MPIQTVLGPIQPEALGTTLMHEHTLCDLWEWGGRVNYTAILDDEELLAEELACYRAAGGSAVVDVTPDGVGRSPAGLRRLAEATGLHVVMGCGWYRERVYPPYVYELSTNQLADRLIAELSDGVDGTGIRRESLVSLAPSGSTSRRSKSASSAPPRGRSTPLA